MPVITLDSQASSGRPSPSRGAASVTSPPGAIVPAATHVVGDSPFSGGLRTPGIKPPTPITGRWGDLTDDSPLSKANKTPGASPAAAAATAATPGSTAVKKIALSSGLVLAPPAAKKVAPVASLVDKKATPEVSSDDDDDDAKTVSGQTTPRDSQRTLSSTTGSTMDVHKETVASSSQETTPGAVVATAPPVAQTAMGVVASDAKQQQQQQPAVWRTHDAYASYGSAPVFGVAHPSQQQQQMYAPGGYYAPPAPPADAQVYNPEAFFNPPAHGGVSSSDPTGYYSGVGPSSSAYHHAEEGVGGYPGGGVYDPAVMMAGGAGGIAGCGPVRFMPPPPPPPISLTVVSEYDVARGACMFETMGRRWYSRLLQVQGLFVPSEENFCPPPPEAFQPTPELLEDPVALNSAVEAFLVDFRQWTDDAKRWWMSHFEHMQKRRSVPPAHLAAPAQPVPAATHVAGFGASRGHHGGAGSGFASGAPRGAGFLGAGFFGGAGQRGPASRGGASGFHQQQRQYVGGHPQQPVSVPVPGGHGSVW